jgi:hypothetical protein
MSVHATVKIGEYTIPLIGIPESATQMECEKCKQIFHITDVALNGSEFVCEKCNKSMTRERAKELLPIIKAFSEGKIVQYKNFGGEWKDCFYQVDISFDESSEEYRIKPE